MKQFVTVIRSRDSKEDDRVYGPAKPADVQAALVRRLRLAVFDPVSVASLAEIEELTRELAKRIGSSPNAVWAQRMADLAERGNYSDGVGAYRVVNAG